MARVSGSASSARTAAAAIRPLTSADRSRPPTPITCDTPTPQRSSSAETSCAPVPAAATTPTGPRRSTFANPSPVPASTAVPAPGPMTSSPSSSGPLLELDLLRQRDVVAEQQHVQAGGQGMMRFERGIRAWHGNDRHVRIRRLLAGGLNRPRGPFRPLVPSLAGGAEDRVGARRQRGPRMLLVRRAHREQEVVGTGIGQAGGPKPCAARSASAPGVAITAPAHAIPGSADITDVATRRTMESA